MDPDFTQNPLCLRLQDRTIRDVIIEGYDLSASSLLSRISNDQDNVRRLTENYGAMDATKKDERRYQALLTYLQQRIDLTKRERERLLKRVDELRASRKPEETGPGSGASIPGHSPEV